MLWILVFAVSLFFLLKSSDYFVDSSLILGKQLGIPTHVIGITLVALGTSLPELAASLASVLKGTHEASSIVIGNVVGSNNTNIFMVLGITAVIAGIIDINMSQIKRFIPILLGSAIWLAIASMDGIFGTVDAVVALLLMVVFLVQCFFGGSPDDDDEEDDDDFVVDSNRWRQIGIFAGSILVIYFSADYLIRSVIELSSMLSIREDIIAASAIALGTSLPELFVSLNAIKKGKQGIAVGNVVGSNIFNSLGVMGIPALITHIHVSDKTLYFALPLMLVATALFLFFIYDKKITRLEGLILVIFYLVFIGVLFI